MAKQRTPSPSRTMKRVFLVFCEGETEETYLDYLKQTYRSPIRIVPKVEGGSISQRLIDATKRELKISKTDKILVFLLFSAMGHPFQQLAEMILRSSVTSGSSLV